MTGRIIRGVGGLYTVLDAQGRRHVCRARGRFRNDGDKPMVGDFVAFSPDPGEAGGYLQDILSRRNAFVRPPVANLDKLLVVLSALQPAPDWPLADRLLMGALDQAVDVALAVNKCEMGDEVYRCAREDYLPAGIPVLGLSVWECSGLDEIRSFLSFEDGLGTVGLAGQSAVGKSSLLNALLGLDLPTGEISRIERGRHTTRHVELLPLLCGGLVADTPGFSVMEIGRRSPDTLAVGWPEFASHAAGCRFTGCQHIGEMGCAVQRAAEAGEISPRRLERYRALHAQVREDWANRYRT